MKIFRSTIIGNEGTPPIQVESLPIEHQVHIDRAENLQQIINDAEKIIEKTTSSYNIILSEKIIKKAKTELDNLQKSCKHHYFYDEVGYPYHYRYCATCKGYMGAI